MKFECENRKDLSITINTDGEDMLIRYTIEEGEFNFYAFFKIRSMWQMEEQIQYKIRYSCLDINNFDQYIIDATYLALLLDETIEGVR